MEKLHLETSVISHAVSRPSADIQIAAMQMQAKNWWGQERDNFEIYVSQLVITEASAGDPTAAAERLELLQGIALLPVSIEAQALAASIVAASLVPQKAEADALHVAVAALGGVRYLLTNNCRHIANAHTMPHVQEMLDQAGCGQLMICTPVQFSGKDDEKPDS